MMLMAGGGGGGRAAGPQDAAVRACADGNAGDAFECGARGASVGFKAEVLPPAEFLSAYFIQQHSTAATHADTGGRRQPMMSSSRVNAPDGTLRFGETSNFETIWSTSVSTTMLLLSAHALSCIAVRFAHARTATRPPVLTNKGSSAE